VLEISDICRRTRYEYRSRSRQELHEEGREGGRGEVRGTSERRRGKEEGRKEERGLSWSRQCPIRLAALSTSVRKDRARARWRRPSSTVMTTSGRSLPSMLFASHRNPSIAGWGGGPTLWHHGDHPSKRVGRSASGCREMDARRPHQGSLLMAMSTVSTDLGTSRNWSHDRLSMRWPDSAWACMSAAQIVFSPVGGGGPDELSAPDMPRVAGDEGRSVRHSRWRFRAGGGGGGGGGGVWWGGGGGGGWGGGG